MLLLKLGGFWRLPPRDFPHAVRVTLWITTAIHLDTPEVNDADRRLQRHQLRSTACLDRKENRALYEKWTRCSTRLFHGRDDSGHGACFRRHRDFPKCRPGD